MPFPVEDKYIVQTELKMKVKFPSSFREKMMEDNGGEIKVSSDLWNLYPFFDTSDKKRIKRTSNNIFRETEEVKKWRGFPEDAVAIASNGSGDQLIFMRSEETPDMLENIIYFWDHETGNISKVVDDFSEMQRISK